MHSSRFWRAAVMLTAGAATLATLHGCQDSPDPTTPDPHGPALAVAVRKTLTVKGGGGNGSGVVTSTPAGITCTITAGVAGTSGCVATFPKGTVVALAAAPRAGDAGRDRGQAGARSGDCQVTMSVNRTVAARFVKGPFTLRIGGGSGGTGSGRVTSQAGLTPAIDCTITAGTPASTGCVAKYPGSVEVVLTAAAAAGSTFSGWGAPCGGTGTCRYVANQTVTVAATFTVSSGSSMAGTIGSWAPAFATPVIAVHMSLLPTGKVILWGQRGESQLWDPDNPDAGLVQVVAPFEVFCSGHTLLSDGRLFVAGGHITSGHGLASAAIFDPASGSWGITAPMAQGRWYPTTTELPNGDVLVLAGADADGNQVAVPEIWDGVGWRRLSTASMTLPYYPRTFVAPNGKVFFAGGTSYYLDVSGTGAWSAVGDRQDPNRGAGSAVMYAPGKILYAGGTSSSTTPPVATAEVIDLNDGAPAWRAVAPMAYPRNHMLATILADGQVLVTHGTSGLGNDQASIVHYAELWNPATEAWTTMDREQVDRAYHSSAVLLPDGRLLSAGSGEGGGVPFADGQLSAQVFSPPYLFNSDGSLAVRPVISAAPATVSYGATITVETAAAGTVTRGTLIRLSSATHSFNQSQLIFPLGFRQTAATTIVADSPPSANVAPPGRYMLFLVDQQGVPSVSRMVSVGP